MKLKALLFATAAVATLATSCKKDENKSTNGTPTAPGASTLTAGTGYVAFNTDKSFNGKTSHVYKSQPPTDNSVANNSSNTVTIQNTQTQISGTSIGNTAAVQLQIRSVKAGSFDFTGTNVTFVISVTNGATLSEGYAMESGTLEVTKFSNEEIEGKFSGKGVNDDANASINITNGTFSAKF